MLGLAGVMAGCDRKDAKAQQAATAERPPAPVTVALAETADVPVYLDEIGKTVSMEVVQVVPQVGGKIVQAPVADGAMVKEGDLLFQIDARPFRAAQNAAEAAKRQAETERGLAQRELDRIDGLQNRSAVSELEYDQKRSAVEMAKAKVASADAAIEQAKLNVEYATIKSPISGRAGARLVVAGNVVQAMDKPLLVVQQLDPIYVEFTVNENDLGTVRKYIAARGLSMNDPSELGLKVLVDVPGDSERVATALGAPTTAPSAVLPSTRPVTGPREGTLTFLDNTVQQATGTVKLRATVKNGDRYFWPGQFVNVRLVLTTKKDAVLVPTLAQQIGQQGPYVYVVSDVRKDGKTVSIAEMRPIVPGQRHGDKVVIERGVEPGERVIVVGQMMIMPGGPVTVVNPPGGAAGGAHASSK
jgi:membrane fusion protein, multidrug efflux system